MSGAGVDRASPRETGADGSSSDGMVDFDDYLAAVLAAVEPLAVERIGIVGSDAQGAVGRFTSQGVPAVWDAPGFTNSAMDGFAVAAADLTTDGGPDTVVLEVSDDIAAGTTGVWRAGTAVRIMTGAPMPEGTDTVVPVEDTDHPSMHRPLPETVRLPADWPEGRHVRKRGTDVAAGQELIGAGTRLDAAALSALMAAGVLSVPVRPRVRAGVIVTGDEIVTVQDIWAAGGALAEGLVVNSNSVLVAETLRAFGADVVFDETCSDDSGELDGLLGRAFTAGIDLLITTGGASVGAHDVARAVLGDAGVAFRAVAMQPAKPQGFGVVDGTLVCALPGNPGAVHASLWVIVRPIVAKLVGARLPAPVAMTVGEAWTVKAGKRTFVPVVVDHGTIRPAFTGGVAAHRARSLARADGLAIVDPEVTVVAVGDRLPVIVTRPG